MVATTHIKLNADNRVPAACTELGLAAGLAWLDRCLAQALAAAERSYGSEAAADPYRGLYIAADEPHRLLDRCPGAPLFAAAGYAAAMAQLRAICAQVRYRGLVYGEWGFADKLALGTGLNVLFAGPSGTGKTMAAEIIAGELGLALCVSKSPASSRSYGSGCTNGYEA